jgi:hypothetical protein
MNKFEIETMEEMEKRLAGSGACAQVREVIKAIIAIKSAPGMLDPENRSTALYHLACALGGKSRAMSSLSDATELAENAS